MTWNDAIGICTSVSTMSIIIATTFYRILAMRSSQQKIEHDIRNIRHAVDGTAAVIADAATQQGTAAAVRQAAIAGQLNGVQAAIDSIATTVNYGRRAGDIPRGDVPRLPPALPSDPPAGSRPGGGDRRA